MDGLRDNKMILKLSNYIEHSLKNIEDVIY